MFKARFTNGTEQRARAIAGGDNLTAGEENASGLETIQVFLRHQFGPRFLASQTLWRHDQQTITRVDGQVAATQTVCQDHPAATAAGQHCGVAGHGGAVNAGQRPGADLQTAIRRLLVNQVVGVTVDTVSDVFRIPGDQRDLFAGHPLTAARAGTEHEGAGHDTDQQGRSLAIGTEHSADAGGLTRRPGSRPF